VSCFPSVSCFVDLFFEDSLASRLRALGGHVSQCMRRALHLGIKKALGVVASHY
jgi:hypothetical protein